PSRGQLLLPAGRPDDFTGNPGRIVGGQEDGHPGDVGRRAEAAEWDGGDHLLALVAVEKFGRALRFGGAGGDRVDPDLPRGQFERKTAGQVVDGGLRGRVEGRLRPRGRAHERAEVNDAAAFGPEVLERLLDGQDGPEDVDAVLPVELFLGDLLDRRESV